MKNLNPLLLAAVLATALSAAVAPASAASDTVFVPSPYPTARKLDPGINEKTFWGFGLGLVFTEVPISESKFTVMMSDLHYGYYLSDPNAFVRTAATIGLYGFALVLPVPKAGLEMIIGDPAQAVQARVATNAFYDISVGGHGGISGEVGVRLKNRVDVMFSMVPVGTDSKRDYLQFVGVHDEPGKKPYVILPYYGIFIAFNY